MTDDHPLVLDSRRLPRQPGASERVVVAVAPEPDLGTDVVTIATEPVEIELLLESVLDGILVTGTTAVRMTGDCVRCLEPVDTPLPIEFRQFFTYPGAEVETDSDEDQDIVAMVGPLLDLRPAFRDATLLALPLSPTCRSDCPGLCPQCGFRMADDPEHRHHTSDPRLAALEGLRDKYAQSESEGE